MGNELLREKPNTIDKIIIPITCLLMVASLSLPFSSMLSYAYQAVVVMVVVLFGKGSVASVIPLLLLSTTRSYIAVSTTSTFVAYLGMNGIMLTLALVGIFAYYLITNNMKVHIMPGYNLLAIFALLMLLSNLVVSNKTEYNDYYIPICLTYLILPLLVKSEQTIFVSRLAYVLAGAWLAIGIVPHLLAEGDIYQSVVQVDRNYQSCFLVICILQTLVFLTSEWKRRSVVFRIVLIVILVFDAYIMLTSASRGAFIALAIGVLLYCVFNFSDFKKVVVFFVIISFAVYVAFNLGVFDKLLERFALEDASSGNGRYDVWKLYLDGIFNSNAFNFLFGHGLTGQTTFGKAAHNLFISIFYSFGFVAFLLIILLVAWCISIFIKAKHKEELVVFIPILFECLSLEPYYRLEFAIYFSLVVASAIFYNNTLVKQARNISGSEVHGTL